MVQSSKQRLFTAVKRRNKSVYTSIYSYTIPAFGPKNPEFPGIFVSIIPYSDEKANNCSIVHCPNLCSFCISGREGNCVILQSLHQNRRHGRGQAAWKGALLLLVSRLMRRLHVAAAYSILHLAGLTLVWYNAGFGLFLG